MCQTYFKQQAELVLLAYKSKMFHFYSYFSKVSLSIFGLFMNNFTGFQVEVMNEGLKSDH